MARHKKDRFDFDVPMVLNPKPLTIAVKRLLGLPVIAPVIFPLGNGQYRTEWKRIA